MNNYYNEAPSKDQKRISLLKIFSIVTLSIYGVLTLLALTSSILQFTSIFDSGLGFLTLLFVISYGFSIATSILMLIGAIKAKNALMHNMVPLKLTLSFIFAIVTVVAVSISLILEIVMLFIAEDIVLTLIILIITLVVLVFSIYELVLILMLKKVGRVSNNMNYNNGQNFQPNNYNNGQNFQPNNYNNGQNNQPNNYNGQNNNQ